MAIRVSPIISNNQLNQLKHVTPAANAIKDAKASPSASIHAISLFLKGSKSTALTNAHKKHLDHPHLLLTSNPSTATMAKAPSTKSKPAKTAPVRGAPAAQKATLESLGKTRAASILEKAAALAAEQQAAKKKEAERPAPLPDGEDGDLLAFDDAVTGVQDSEKEPSVETVDLNETAKTVDTSMDTEAANNNTNEHIQNINQPFQAAESPINKDSDDESMESPSNSPVKKKTKKDMLNSLITRKPTASKKAQEKEASQPKKNDSKSAKSTNEGKKSDTAKVSYKEAASKEKSSSKPQSVLKESKYPTSAPIMIRPRPPPNRPRSPMSTITNEC